jgi:cell division inhibitor SepF
MWLGLAVVPLKDTSGQLRTALSSTGQTMDDLDPATAASLEDLAACLKHIHLLADKPSYRALEQQSGRGSGSLPGTRLQRVILARSTISDVLCGRKFPGKAFLLTFVDACGIDVENDRRWEQAWDRLAVQYQQASTPGGEVEKLRQENEELHQQLKAAKQQAEAAKVHTGRSEHMVNAADLARITTLHPRTYNEARTVGEHFRDGTPVVINLTEMADSDAKRLVDWSAGLIFGLRGSIERVTEKVFLLTPANVEVTAEDKARVAEYVFSEPRPAPSSDPRSTTRLDDEALRGVPPARDHDPGRRRDRDGDPIGDKTRPRGLAGGLFRGRSHDDRELRRGDNGPVIPDRPSTGLRETTPAANPTPAHYL